MLADIGFTPAEAADLTAKNLDYRDQGRHRAPQTHAAGAARLCGTDRPTLSKAFRGCVESVTIDRLARWLHALGRDAEIIVKRTSRSSRQGRLRVIEAV